jgi:hypothetical protein
VTGDEAMALVRQLRQLARDTAYGRRVLHPGAKCKGGEHVGCGDRPVLVLYGEPRCERDAFIELVSDG